MLDKQRKPGLNDQDELWLKLRNECDVAAFSRSIIRELIAGKPDAAIKNNYLPFYLEWLYRKPITQLSCEEILRGLKKLLETTNIFKSFTFNRVADEPNTIRIVGFIGLNHETSEFYARYITNFLEKYCDCKVASFITSSGITLTVELSKDIYWEAL